MGESILEELVKKYAEAFGVSIEEASEKIKVLKETITVAVDKVREFLSRICELIKKFIKNNPLIINKIKKSKRYSRRVENRNKLYIKQKSLGKRL